jgi:hypothetical protein
MTPRRISPAIFNSILRPMQNGGVKYRTNSILPEQIYRPMATRYLQLETATLDAKFLGTVTESFGQTS